MKRLRTLWMTLGLMVGSAPVFAIDYGAILIDVSASMNMTRLDGGTRCDVAFQAAEKALSDFFRVAGGKKVKIYTFEASGQLKAITSDYVGQSAAASALAAVPRACEGYATALAESVCSIVDDLRARGRTIANPDLALFIMTDGQENDSRSCVDVANFTPDRYLKSPWHSAVFNRVMNGSAVKVASLVFWPEINEIPDDFEFLKYLSLVSGSNMGGGLSSTGPVQPTLPDAPGKPGRFSVLSDEHQSDLSRVIFW